MALPNIEVRVTADTASAEAGFDRVETGLDHMGSAATRANSKVNAINMPMRRVTRSSGAMRSAIQNASFQIGDMAVMMEMGASMSRTLGQQLPQLLGGFGAFGAVLGTVVAIGIPMVSMFKGMSDSGRDMTEVFGTLQPLVKSIGDAFSNLGAYAVTAAELIVNNIDRILVIAGTTAAFFAGKWVAAFVAARIATFNLSTALIALRGALIRTGIGALIVAAGELVYQFTRLVKAAGGLGNAFNLVMQIAREAFQNIDILAQALMDGLQATAYYVAAAFLDAFDQIRSGFADLVNFMLSSPILEAMGIDLGEMASQSIKGGDFGETAKELRGRASDLFGSSASGFEAAIPSLGKIRDLMAGMKDDKITLPDLMGIGEEDAEGGSGGKSKASQKLDEELSAQEERIKEHFDRIKALTEGGLSDKLGAWGSYFGNLVNMTGSNSQKLLGIQKSFAAAQALIDAWGAHNKVLNDPTLPWYARIASAATVLASGIGAVNAIRSVSSSGSGGATSAGGSTSGATQTAAQQPLDVRVSGLSSGQLMDGMDVGALLERLQDEAGDRGLRITVAR